jgi:3-hydroxybutyryl-CoA dehydratase
MTLIERPHVPLFASSEPQTFSRKPLMNLPGDNPKMPVAEMQFEDMSIGTHRELRWVVEGHDLDRFAALSGDHNPLHVDETFARNRGFPARVGHGLLLGAKISAFLGTIMPGRDCLLLETQIAWPHPYFAGDIVKIRGEIVTKSTENRVIKIKLRATASRVGCSLLIARGWALCQIQS